MADKRLRAVVTEETYGVHARIDATGVEYRSDEIAIAMRISERLRDLGRRSEIASGADGTVVQLALGDAPERDFEEAAGEMLEAASW